MNILPNRFPTTLILFVLFAICTAQVSSAFADTQPVTKLVNGVLIDPASADSFYYPSGAATPTHTAGLCALNSVMCSNARPFEVQELSAALSQGGALSESQYIKNVYEYVYKNIDTEFRYGLSKGYFGTLLDQSGTSFDQANLMVELLRQGNLAASYHISASYVVGTIDLTPAQFQAWTGLTNALAACQFLANGGVPAIVNNTNSCSNISASASLSSLTISHIWVSADGILYDPSFKTYTQNAGIDLPSAMGCGTKTASTCGATAQSVSIPSGSQGYNSSAQAYYVNNVQYANLGNTLNGYALGLENYVLKASAGLDVKDLVGGRKINLSSMPAAGTSLPYANVNTQHTWTGDIPDPYRSRIHVQFSGIDTWLFADEISGYWIYVGGLDNSTTQRTVTLYLEADANSPWEQGTIVGLPLISGQVSYSTSLSCPLTLSLDHPYAAMAGAYMDDTFSKTLYCGDYGPQNHTSGANYVSPFLIVQSWGRTGRGSVERFQRMAASKAPAPGRTPILGRPSYLVNMTLPSTVATWLSQAGLAVDINDAVGGTRTQEQHTLGLVVEELVGNSYAQGIPGLEGLDAVTSLSITSNTGASAPATAAFAAEAVEYNAFEGSAIEQNMGGPDGQSSVRWFEFANEKGYTFYQATAANYNAVFSHSTGYVAGAAAFLQGYFGLTNPSFNVIMPNNGQMTFSNGSSSATYYYGPALAFSVDGTQFGYVTTNGAKGAGTPVAGDPVATVLQTLQTSRPDKPFTYEVNATTGALTVLMAPDMTTGVGAFPVSLSYQRYYEAGQLTSPTCLQQNTNTNIYCSFQFNQRLWGGWSDNFQISATVTNDGFRGLGWDSALDATQAIAALYTIRDLAGNPSFNEYIAQTFVAAWLTDQLSGNEIAVKRPPAHETFMRLPDGAFAGRPGTGGYVQLTGSARARIFNGSSLQFCYQGYSFNEVGKGGDALSFKSASMAGVVCYWDAFEPTTWHFPNGINLNFSYTTPAYSPDVMSGVSNNLGRSLTFAADSSAASDPDGYTANGAVITDDSGRTVQIRDVLSTSGSQYGLQIPASEKIILPDKSQMRANFAVVSSATDYLDTRLDSITLPNNYTTKYIVFSYDPLYRVSSSTDILGHSTTYFPGRMSYEQWARGSAVDPVGAVKVAYADKFIHPLETIDEINRVTTYAYDDVGRTASKTNPAGDVVTYTYDARGNALQTTKYPATGSTLAPISTYASYGVGADSSASGGGSAVLVCGVPATCNKMSSVTDARGNVTNYSWDSTGNLTEILKPADGAGNKAEADVNYTSYTGTDGAAVYLPNTETEVIARAAGGAPSQTLITSYAFNTSNKYVLQTATVDVGGLKLATNFTFDAIGNLTGVTDPRTNTTNYVWDQNRRLTYKIEPPAPATVNGQVQTLRIAEHYIYDPNSELVETDKGYASQGLSDGSDFSGLEKATFTYDSVGNKIQETAPTAVGQPAPAGLTEYAYDADDRLQCAAVRMGPPNYGSAPVNGCSLSNSADRITELGYDAAGQKLVEARGVGTGVGGTGAGREQIYASYTYTLNGKVATVTDASWANIPVGAIPVNANRITAGNTTCYIYDGFDRLQQTEYPVTTAEQATCDAKNDVETFAYDANDNKLSWTKRDGSTVISYCYDALNRQVAKYVRAAGVAVTCLAGQALPTLTGTDVATTYDLMDKVSSALFVGNLGISYGYDTAERLTSETTSSAAGSKTMKYTLDANGNATQVIWLDGTPTSGFYAGYVYDALNRVSAVNDNGATSGAGVLASYAYDNFGRMVSLTRGNGASTTYTYDPVGSERLQTLTQNFPANTSPSGTQVAWTFSYNAANQVVGRSLSNTAFQWTNYPAAQGRTYDGLNRDAGIASTNPTTFKCPTASIPANAGYDCNGNELQDAAGARHFTYDLENRLLCVGPNSAACQTGGTPTASLTYDPLGRLEQYVTSGTTTTNFLYRADKLSAEYGPTGNLLRRYVQGPGTDEPLVWYDYASGSPVLNWLHVDRQGSVIATSTVKGQVTTYAYGPYGEPQAWGGSRFAYTGQIQLPEAQLYHYKARAYDPTSGRFLQTDPVGYEDDIDWYAYVGEDPLDKADPTGENVYCAKVGCSQQAFKDSAIVRCNGKCWAISASSAVIITAAVAGGPEVAAAATATAARGAVVSGIAGAAVEATKQVATSPSHTITDPGAVAAAGARSTVTGAASALGGASAGIPGAMTGAALGTTATGGSSSEAGWAAAGAAAGRLIIPGGPEGESAVAGALRQFVRSVLGKTVTKTGNGVSNGNPHPASCSNNSGHCK